jgi:hypothetical protein
VIDLHAALAWAITLFDWEGHAPVFSITWASLVEDDAWALVMPRDGVQHIAVDPELQCAPNYVVRYLVAHEVLHVRLPPHGRSHHHRAFRVADRLLPYSVRANTWLRAHA